jgi:site-specific recombinase XerD
MPSSAGSPKKTCARQSYHEGHAPQSQRTLAQNGQRRPSRQNPQRHPSLSFCMTKGRSLFCLALDSGARLSELLSLRLCNLELLSRCAKVKGKGNKERMMDFGTLTSQLLSRYLTACLTRFGALSQDSFLFLTDDGRPISKRQGQDRWKKWQRRAGLTPLPFHGLRHGFARMWLLKGGDAFSLQLLLGQYECRSDQALFDFVGK